MINKADYELYAECIRSDQMSAREVNDLMESNSVFKKWYYLILVVEHMMFLYLN
jgi:hypothetical protein